MVIIGEITKVTEIRKVEFQKRDGSKDEADCQGIVVKSCEDEIYVEAFGDIVEKLKEQGMQMGDVVQMSATCSVRERKGEKGIFHSNNLRLNGMQFIIKKDRAF